MSYIYDIQGFAQGLPIHTRHNRPRQSSDDVDGLTEDAYDVELLADDTHSIIDQGKLALLHGTFVGKVDAEGAHGTGMLADDAHGTYNRPRQTINAVWYILCWQDLLAD